MAISSLAYLAIIGAVAYMKDFSSAAKQIKEIYVNGVCVIHRIPLNIGCSLNTITIRAWIDVDRWLSLAWLINTRKILYEL